MNRSSFHVVEVQWRPLKPADALKTLDERAESANRSPEESIAAMSRWATFMEKSESQGDPRRFHRFGYAGKTGKLPMD